MSRRTGPARWITRAAIPAALTGLLASTGLAGATPAAPAAPEGKPWVKLAEVAENEWLHDVSLVSETDGWVVGQDGSGPYAAHWDGQELTRSDLGDLSEEARTYAVEAISSDDVWAVSSGPGQMGSRTTYLRSHWDGKRWTHEESEPPEDSGLAVVTDLRAFGPDDVWAVGREKIINQFKTKPFVDHYDGNRWTQMELPKEFQTELQSSIIDVDGNGGNDVWILANLDPSTDHDPLIAHWDGAKFTTIKLPTNWDPHNITVSGQQVWATGVTEIGNDPVAYKYDGTTWTEWSNRPLDWIEDMHADHESGKLVASGCTNGAFCVDGYATFDGNDWTVSPPPDGITDGRHSAVTHAPGTGRPMAVAFGGSTSYLAAPTD